MEERSEKGRFVSVVVPVYNEANGVKTIADKLIEILNNEPYKYEIIFVDDGSSDSTWLEISSLGKSISGVKGVSFTRNFGKEAALIAGIASSKGDAVITMDSDFQHPPEKIVDFLHMWENGYKIVEGVKNTRGKESFIHRQFSNLFYKLMSKAVGQEMRNTSDFKLLDREVVNVLLAMPERQLFYRAISRWTGFSSTTVEYDVGERLVGKSKWSSRKLIGYAFRNISSYTVSPLYIIFVFGVMFFMIALVIGVISLVKWARGNAVEGFTTVIFLQLISGSNVMIALGIIGYYLGKVIEEVKSRPRYVVRESVGSSKDGEEKQTN